MPQSFVSLPVHMVFSTKHRGLSKENHRRRPKPLLAARKKCQQFP